MFLSGPGKKQVRTSELCADDYEDICRDLNVRNPGKDYKTLAGKMGYTIRDVRKFELEKNPTDALLSYREAKSGNTVDKLIEILKSMGNDVVAEKLEQAWGKISTACHNEYTNFQLISRRIGLNFTYVCLPFWNACVTTVSSKKGKIVPLNLEKSTRKRPPC